MSRLTRNGTAEPVSRGQIIRHERGQGNINFPCLADHDQDWQPYLVDPYSAISDDYTSIHNVPGTVSPTYTYSPNVFVISSSHSCAHWSFFLFLFFFHLTYSRWTSSLPSCLWSQRIFPSLPGSRLTNVLSRCKFSTLTTRQPMVEFYLLTFPLFPLRKKEHKSYQVPW